jgi:hypothetical protein
MKKGFSRGGATAQRLPGFKPLFVAPLRRRVKSLL